MQIHVLYLHVLYAVFIVYTRAEKNKYNNINKIKLDTVCFGVQPKYI